MSAILKLKNTKFDRMKWMPYRVLGWPCWPRFYCADKISSFRRRTYYTGYDPLEIKHPILAITLSSLAYLILYPLVLPPPGLKIFIKLLTDHYSPLRTATFDRTTPTDDVFALQITKINDPNYFRHDSSLIVLHLFIKWEKGAKRIALNPKVKMYECRYMFLVDYRYAVYHNW